MARGAVRLESPVRMSECRECGATLHDYRLSGRMAERCRACKLAAKSEYQRRTKPPKLVVTDACVDCGGLYERSSYATTRVRCEPCRLAYAVEARRRYAAEHPEVHRAASLKWLKSNLEYANQAAHRRRVLARESVEQFTRDEIFERDGWVCQICLEPVDRSIRFPANEAPSLDHIVPVSRGGNHTRDNVQLAHMGCNRRKGNRCG